MEKARGHGGWLHPDGPQDLDRLRRRVVAALLAAAARQGYDLLLAQIQRLARLPVLRLAGCHRRRSGRHMLLPE